MQDSVPRIWRDKEEDVQIKQAVENLLKIGAISYCEPCAGQFLSSFFLVKKSNGGMRFVLNLKSWNKFVEVNHFKIKDIRMATSLLAGDAYMATIDLQDAYFFSSCARI